MKKYLYTYSVPSCTPEYYDNAEEIDYITRVNAQKEWLDNNVRGRWVYNHMSYPNPVEIGFIYSDDAIAFKLRFS